MDDECFYEISPERRAEMYMERLPLVGQPFPYNSEVCDFPPEMMFMHDVVFSEAEKVDNVEVWEQINKVTPEIDKMWEMLQALQQRVEALEKKDG